MSEPSWQGVRHLATDLSAVAVTRASNAFYSEELADFKNKAATAYAPRNAWDWENGKMFFHS